MSASLDQTPSFTFLYTSTSPSEINTSSTDSTSTSAFSHATVIGPSATGVLACNSIAIIACVFVLVAYVCLYRKHRLLMRRTSLTLSCAMAASELMLHVSHFCKALVLRQRYYLNTTLAPMREPWGSKTCFRPGFACISNHRPMVRHRRPRM